MKISFCNNSEKTSKHVGPQCLGIRISNQVFVVDECSRFTLYYGKVIYNVKSVIYNLEPLELHSTGNMKQYSLWKPGVAQVCRVKG